MSDDLLIDHDAGVTMLTINRPPLNLMTLPLLEAIVAALEMLKQRDETRAIVIRGAGTRAFCAGADLKSGEETNPASASAMREVGMRMIDLIEEHPKPVISAVRGWCIGGGTAIAWPADIRLAAASAKFRAGDIYLGLAPSWGLAMLGSSTISVAIGRSTRRFSATTSRRRKPMIGGSSRASFPTRPSMTRSPASRTSSPAARPCRSRRSRRASGRNIATRRIARCS